MSRYAAYLRTASQFIESYNGEIPFSRYIKSAFSQSKKYGATDRRLISGLCHSFFRVGYLVSGSLTHRILAGWFITRNNTDDLLETLNPQWSGQVTVSLSEKLKLFGIPEASLFPGLSYVSDELDKSAIALSVLEQPLLYVRIRPGHEEVVLRKLDDARIAYHREDRNTLSFANSTSLDKVLSINKEVVIQDLNSQRVFDALSHHLFNKSPIMVWDCCAASGGKSALIYDRYNGNVVLTVSDIRKSILHQLDVRMKEADIPIADLFMADLTQGEVKHGTFDFIICDVPCSGSGTWARTPEQLSQFNKDKIIDYAHLQRTIVEHSIHSLQPGGVLSYITCSIFKAENEENVHYLLNNTKLTLLDKRYLPGYTCKADTLFSALFQLAD